jgi:hypothetical protein
MCCLCWYSNPEYCSTYPIHSIDSSILNHCTVTPHDKYTDLWDSIATTSACRWENRDAERYDVVSNVINV